MTDPITWWMWGSDAVIIIGAYALGRAHASLLYKKALDGFLCDVAELRGALQKMKMMRDMDDRGPD